LKIIVIVIENNVKIKNGISLCFISFCL